jgi:hypothetical protein
MKKVDPVFIACLRALTVLLKILIKPVRIFASSCTACFVLLIGLKSYWRPLRKCQEKLSPLSTRPINLRRRISQMRIDNDLRVLVLISTKDRPTTSYSCISTLQPVPNQSRIIVFDDNSNHENDKLDKLKLTRIKSTRTLGANGSGLCRFAIALAQIHQYDYFYFTDNDIYHSSVFWYDINELVKLKVPGAISPALWPRRLHKVVITGEFRRDLSISGASIVLQKQHLLGAFLTILIDYQWGNHGWDWSLSKYVCANCQIVSPINSIVQHLGYNIGLHPEILTDQFQGSTKYISADNFDDNLSGTSNRNLCLLMGLDDEDLAGAFHWLSTFDELITPDPTIASYLMERDLDNIYLESCDTRIWLESALPYCESLTMWSLGALAHDWFKNCRDVVSAHFRLSSKSHPYSTGLSKAIYSWWK